MSETTAETAAERRARLQAELAESEVTRQRAAFAAEAASYVAMPAGNSAQDFARESRLQVLDAVRRGLADLVTRARRGERNAAAAAAREWWRTLRKAEADRWSAEADALPEYLPWIGGSNDR
jgi:hypothetical protein